MDKQTYERGLEIRKSVLGKEFVEKSIASADDFNRPLQELVTEYCWGAVWGREGLNKKTRSIINLAMISALNRPHELKMHVKGALRNGLTRRRDPRGAAAGRHLLRRAGGGRLVPGRARGAERVRPGQVMRSALDCSAHHQRLTGNTTSCAIWTLRGWLSANEMQRATSSGSSAILKVSKYSFSLTVSPR